jgi:hypothetical protein
MVASGMVAVGDVEEAITLLEAAPRERVKPLSVPLCAVTIDAEDTYVRDVVLDAEKYKVYVVRSAANPKFIIKGNFTVAGLPSAGMIKISAERLIGGRWETYSRLEKSAVTLTGSYSFDYTDDLKRLHEEEKRRLYHFRFRAYAYPPFSPLAAATSEYYIYLVFWPLYR